MPIIASCDNATGNAKREREWISVESFDINRYLNQSIDKQGIYYPDSITVIAATPIKLMKLSQYGFKSTKPEETADKQ